MSRRPLAVLLALMTVLLLAAAGCSGLRAQARSGASGSKDCKSCERMCEVAGESQKNPGAVDKCKADCAKKCG